MIGGARVLVVEDEFLVAAMIADMVEDGGGHVIGPASNVAEALDHVGTGGVDVAVVDWNLAGEPGEKVAEALHGAGIPFVISTGYGTVSGQFADRPVLAKPYPAGVLLAELARLVGKSA